MSTNRKHRTMIGDFLSHCRVANTIIIARFYILNVPIRFGRLLSNILGVTLVSQHTGFVKFPEGLQLDGSKANRWQAKYCYDE